MKDLILRLYNNEELTEAEMTLVMKKDAMVQEFILDEMAKRNVPLWAFCEYVIMLFKDIRPTFVKDWKKYLKEEDFSTIMLELQAVINNDQIIELVKKFLHEWDSNVNHRH